MQAAEPERILRGISDSYGVDVKGGDKLHVCCNQYVDRTDLSGKRVLIVHFKLVGERYESKSECRCGACGYEWHFEPDQCDCQEKPPLDPKEQTCCVQ